MSDPFVSALFGLAGALLGLAADTLAHRWPEHEPGYARPRYDWRTLTVVLVGGIAAGAGGALGG